MIGILPHQHLQRHHSLLLTLCEFAIKKNPMLWIEVLEFVANDGFSLGQLANLNSEMALVTQVWHPCKITVNRVLYRRLLNNRVRNYSRRV
jgi:hypothetical protein